MIQVFLLVFASFALSLALTAWVRRRALAQNRLDEPVARSSHVTPTPRGGGLGIAVTFYLALGWLWLMGTVPTPLAAALVPGLALVAIGYLDDRQSQSAFLRIAVHLGVAGLAMAGLGGWPTLDLGFTTWDWPDWAGFGIGTLAIAWAINFVNFMDGIDGLAGTEALFFALAGLLLLPTEAGALLLAALGAASTGFLILNWPPAKIFMGDVASGLIGYVFAVIALYESQVAAAPIWPWVIVIGIFLVDATVTLMRRIAQGAKPWEAHRSHAYQWAARRFQSHQKVTLGVLALNLVWLLPLACLAARWPTCSLAIAGLALVPLIALALRFHAGRPE